MALWTPFTDQDLVIVKYLVYSGEPHLNESLGEQIWGEMSDQAQS